MSKRESLHQAEVKVSEILESHGIPDPYFWKINKNGKLIPENSDTPIENIIITNNPVGLVELQAFQKIQDKAPNMLDGDHVLWISPIHSVYYPKTSKIIITKKVGETLFNRSINTDWDEIGSLLAAKELATLSDLDPNIFKSINDIRANPIFINYDKEEDLGRAIKKMLSKESIEMMQTNADFKAKAKFINDSLTGKKVKYGNHSLSCEIRMVGRSAFEVFSGKDKYGSLEFKCPKCDKTNKRPHGELISHCQHCGCDVRCE